MNRKIFLHGLLSGILAATAAIIYDRIYFFATEIDFSRVLNPPVMIGLNVIIGLLAGFAYVAFRKSLKEKADIVFGFFFSIFSFACIMVPISMTLPLTISSPELFPGLAVPMVFFPALAWFTSKPLFKLDKE